MAEARPGSVLGNFDDVSFSHFGRETQFFRRGDEFWVRAENADGEREDFRVEYTFGVTPLQQYLVPGSGGRLQALTVAWDSRPAAEGGQRWFHLYPDEDIPPDDPLHWTGAHFNWNYMCADCHSTGLIKNYDVAADTYRTAFAEISVGCEACHGPGSKHLRWAREYQKDTESKSGESFTESETGLVVSLREPKPGAWAIDPVSGQPKRSPPLESHAQVEVCARCHSHRRPIQDGFFHGQRFLDTHLPSALHESLYHPDGQIKEEVYVFGSFTQSRMFHHGVRCSDCHDPHTARTIAPGNALCIRCHSAPKYDSPEHHFHPPESAGASCTACHMPGKHYMVVDYRLDHSIRIPRPDLSVKLGVPNACTGCHEDQDDQWAAATVSAWYGHAPDRPPHFGEALARGRRNPRLAITDLAELAQNRAEPSVARAAALDLLRNVPTKRALEAIAAALEDPDPLVRAHGAGALESLAPDQRIELGSRLLFDPIRAVRIEAARMLASANRANLAPRVRAALESGISEFIEAQSAVADRPGGHMALALLFSDLGKIAEAEDEYRAAFRVDPTHVPSRINLAEMLSESNRIDDAVTLLEEAARRAPQDSFAREALGRFYIRRKDYQRGMRELKAAVELDPERPEIQYFYGVGLNSLGQYQSALPFLTRAHQLDPDNPEYLTGLATIARDAGDLETAARFASLLVQKFPSNPGYLELHAMIALQHGDLESAAASAAQLADQFPGNPQYKSLHLQIQSLLRQPADAR